MNRAYSKHHSPLTFFVGDLRAKQTYILYFLPIPSTTFLRFLSYRFLSLFFLIFARLIAAYEMKLWIDGININYFV